ncbi:glycosyltransferase family 4 protein [Lachnoanaerobaculum sp. OBRC5-5]|uniref:glycosyltransferase family 4 protein n=1 Tax=Lachnoanaerobaculum sp. OBRC5-5 TaxID=936595 RepID=UPI00028256B2|nr:glycosyltransferase family 4 protein [Lachnoanaerobaculum sp. OBRC5-5]EJZ70196.1 hypothetical protein HMPREF1135_01032 [Lachnoanaerobaculum sp. OBRC5-5]
MKVMIIAPYIYDENLIEFTKNKTGFGIMVRNIAKSVGELEDVVLLTRVITRGKKEKNFKILSHTWREFFSNAKLKDWIRGLSTLFSKGVTLKDRARHVFYEVDGGYLRHQIQLEKPDIVHIHGIGTITLSYIRICEEMKVRYAVTLHGLIGLNESVSAPAYEKRIEREFLIKAEKNNIPTSVISSGMRVRIEKNYLLKKANNITVILNGVRACRVNRFNNIKEAANLTEEMFQEYYSKCLKQKDLYPKLCDIYDYLKSTKEKGKKILFFVGNISKNKNQTQAIEIVKKFDNILLVLWGRELDNGEVRNKILKYGLQRNVILGGFNDQMSNFWELCDINLFLSLNDGFGLPIVEGYMHGVPCVTFSDLDATQDLYCPEAMLRIEDRSIEVSTNTLKLALNKNWNSEEITEVSKLFSIDIMSQKYVNWYKDIMMQPKS